MARVDEGVVRRSFREVFTASDLMAYSQSYLLDGDRLVGLSARDSGLESCEWVGRLVGLRWLDLSGNEIGSCAALEPLEELEELRLTFNNVTDVGFLLSLRRLQFVDLRNNPILRVPPALVTLDLSFASTDNYQRGILLDWTRLKEPPGDVTRRGLDAIRSYLLDRIGGARPISQARLVVIGPAGAGKTTIIGFLKCSLTEDTGEDLIRAGRVQLDGGASGVVWEVRAGPWSVLHRLIAEPDTVYLLVLSADGIESPEPWLQMVDAAISRAKVLVVVNKADLVSPESWPVPKLAGRSNIVDFRTVSCLRPSDMAGLVSAVSSALANTDVYRRSMVPRWDVVRSSLKTQAPLLMERDKFHEYCEANGVADSDEALMSLRALGEVIYCGSYPLAGLVVTDPLRFVGIVVGLVADDSPLRAVSQYLMDLVELDDVLRRGAAGLMSIGERRYLVDVMLQRGILIPVGSHHVIMPDLLPDQPPNTGLSGATRCVMRFAVRDARLLVHSVIARLALDAQPGEWWSSSALLRDGVMSCTASILALEPGGGIEVQVIGERRREYLAVIRKEIREVAADRTSEVGPLELIDVEGIWIPLGGVMTMNSDAARESLREVLVGPQS